VPTLSVCIEMFWSGIEPEEKVKKAAALGYDAFEFWGFGNKNLDAIRAAMDETGLRLAACCMGPNGGLTNRARCADMVAGLPESIEVAKKLGTSRLILTTGNLIPDESFETTRRRVVRALKEMAKPAEDAGMTLVLEPLNTLANHFGYWLAKMPEAVDIVDEVDSPAVKILMDIYHQQIMEGNIIDNIRRFIDRIGHFHTAGVPGRHELVGGELDYRGIFRAVDETPYDGFVGLEFKPTIGDEAALEQALGLVGPPAIPMEGEGVFGARAGKCWSRKAADQACYEGGTLEQIKARYDQILASWGKPGEYPLSVRRIEGHLKWLASEGHAKYEVVGEGQGAIHRAILP